MEPGARMEPDDATPAPDALPVARVPETPPPAVETEPKAPEPAPVASTAAFDATVGYWRKIDAECPNEEPLMDIMDMNVVFRQAAGLLNYLRVERPTPDSWGVASSAGVGREVGEKIARRVRVPGARGGGVALMLVREFDVALGLSLLWGQVDAEIERNDGLETFGGGECVVFGRRGALQSKRARHGVSHRLDLHGRERQRVIV